MRDGNDIASFNFFNDAKMSQNAMNAANESIGKELSAHGYDGIVYKNANEDIGSDSYIATQPGTVFSRTTGKQLYSGGSPFRSSEDEQ